MTRAALVLSALLTACTPQEPVPAASPGPGPAEEPASAALPPVEHAHPTTDGDQALDGLDLQIQNATANVEKLPRTRDGVLTSLGARMALAGRTSDLDRMFAIAGDDGPLRARALLAAHRFDEAQALDPSVADSVHLARHQELDRLITERTAALEARPSTTAAMRLGDALAAKGDLRGADAAYARALALYRDVSPLTVADVQFRRGLLWGESGEDPERAKALYADAVARLPGFVRARVHLAELHAQAGDLPTAIELVRPVATAEDPEPGGKLALWLEGEEAGGWKLRTTKRYDALLAAHPLAFADHAAEFFLAVGETERARELAKANVDNRRTPRALDLCERAGCTPAPVPDPAPAASP